MQTAPMKRERYPEFVGVKLTTEQNERLRRLAKANGVTICEYVRWALVTAAAVDAENNETERSERRPAKRK